MDWKNATRIFLHTIWIMLWFGSTLAARKTRRIKIQLIAGEYLRWLSSILSKLNSHERDENFRDFVI